ncbi:Uncharacterised protein [Vibrio cholerae]|nr:Uncharacterised protein [Vibrio cholerae]
MKHHRVTMSPQSGHLCYAQTRLGHHYCRSESKLSIAREPIPPFPLVRCGIGSKKRGHYRQWFEQPFGSRGSTCHVVHPKYQRGNLCRQVHPHRSDNTFCP